MQLRQLEKLPENILTATHNALYDILPEPTLIHLPGNKGRPLFISALQHGNEPTGFLAIQKLLRKYQHQELPRPVTIFLGNTLAAKYNLRRLDDQPDYNRIWPGTELPSTPESEITREIVDVMKQRDLFASVDIHNNTGLNPHYACINKVDYRFLQLASLFSRLIVYFIRPKGVQSAAFAQLCPAVTLECGRPGQQYGVDHAMEFLDGCLHLAELPDHPVPQQDINIFHTVAQVTIPENIEFTFSNSDAHLQLNEDLERMNFTELSSGTVLGKINNDSTIPLIARDEEGIDVTHQFFRINANELVINRKTMPSMLTLDERVIRQDCFCYLMERLQL